MSEAEEVAAVLAGEPGRTPVELRDALRARGRVSITAADVSTVLRTHPGRFRPDAGDPQRWWPTATAVARPAAAVGPAGAAGAAGAAGPLRLYPWQVEAFAAWQKGGGRGVVEAVTGTGKTMLGITAAAAELARGGQVCVLVPTTELLHQWRATLHRCLPATTSVGLLGGGQHERIADHDVLVAVVNSARDADLRPRRPGGLLIGDECHRYGTDVNRAALETGFARRLGLSATFARPDEGHLAWLAPYFGPTCFRMGYGRAIAEGVAAHFLVALMAVRFEPPERAVYDDLSRELVRARAVLISRFGVPPEPFGIFLRAVANLARSDGDGPAGLAARLYLGAMQDRRRLLAETPAKTSALGRLVPAFLAAARAIVFTQTIDGAERAATVLRELGVHAAAIHSGLDRSARYAVLAGFRSGDLLVVTAPQVLDEGVDVPAADLAVILASSRSRRQMIQRMGRVLRRKPDGAAARFVIVHVEGTVEDPALGAHGTFLGEVTEVADAVRRFPAGSATDDLHSFLAPAG